MPRRRDLFQLGALGALAGIAFADGKLPNGTTDAAHAKVTHETFGDLKVYYDGPTDQLSAMTAGSLMLKPGMSPHPPHQHQEEEIMLVTEGRGEISIEGRVSKVGAGAMMFCGAGKLHGGGNTGKAPLLVYYYKGKK